MDGRELDLPGPGPEADDDDDVERAAWTLADDMGGDDNAPPPGVTRAEIGVVVTRDRTDDAFGGDGDNGGAAGVGVGASFENGLSRLRHSADG